MSDDSAVVCEICKHKRSADDCYETPICSKNVRVKKTPEGVTETYCRITWYALEQFRAENNGRCPHFEEKFSIAKFVKAMLKRGGR